MDEFLLEYSLDDTNFIAIYNDQGFFTCQTKDSPNDILESDNIIVTFGKNFIEFFSYSQIIDNNNINNNKIIYKLEKKYEIPINNNNNNNNNNIINNDNNINIINNQDVNDEILCFEVFNNFIICGHQSGKISTWQSNNGINLQKQGEQKICSEAINKMLLRKFVDNKKDLILCCSDKTLKVFSLEVGTVVNIVQLEDEVMDIKTANNYDNQNVFIISLKNGLLKVFNDGLKILFDITSRFNINKTRKVISMKNLSQDNSMGDYVLITEGNSIDIYRWIKPGSFKPKFQGGPNKNITNNNGNMSFPHHPHQGFYGPHIFPNYSHRGGKY